MRVFYGPLITGMLTIFSGTSCNNSTDILFPAEAGEYAAPETVALQFGPPQKINWPDSPSSLTSVPGNFNFDKLPVIRFDSLGFQPFPKPPEESSFDWNKLPVADFKYDSLPSIPLRFKTSVLAPPEVLKAGRPVLKNSKADIIFDFGGELDSVPIEALFKTKDGFTWIATKSGLYRYDGENLFLYNISGQSSATMAMAEDNDNHLWIITRRNGLFVLDFKNGVSRNISAGEGLPPNTGLRIMADRDNRIWASFFPPSFSVGSAITGGFVAIVDQAGGTLKFLRQAQGLSTESPTACMQDKNSNIWVTTVYAGINILDIKNNHIRYLDKAHGLNTDTLTVLNEDHRGRIWVNSFFGQLNIIDVEKNNIKKFGEQQGFKRTFAPRIMEDHNGNTWLGSDRGVKVIDPEIKLVKTIDRSTGLDADINTQLLEDARHQVLVGNTGGLNILSRGGLSIRRAGSFPISTLLEDSRGRIWIGTQENGIQILDTATGFLKQYNHTHGLSDDFIQYMVEYNGSVILSTQKGGIEIIDTSLKRIERIGTAQGLSSANIFAIEKDKQNNTWLAGGSNGLDILDLQNKNIRHIGKAEGLNDSIIVDIKRDQKGFMWFYSLKNGIGVIDTDNKTVQHIIRSDYKSLTGAAEDNLLMHDSRGNTWMSSSINGLFMISAARDSVTHFTTAQGLLGNTVTYLKEYNGAIYAGTGNGLNILMPPALTADKKWKIASLGKSNGITKNVRTYNSDLLPRNGQYWWGDDGITIISRLDERSKDTMAPATYITGLEVFNYRQDFVDNPWKNTSENDTIWGSDGKNISFYTGGKPTSQLSGLNKDDMQWDSLASIYQLPVNLRLPYDKNYLQFHFAQLHLGTQDNVWYRYIFEGIDKEWSEQTNKEFSENYPNIPPGNYTFKVSSFYKGKWCTPVAFSFTITPPWWKTWWAYLIYALAGTGLLRAYIVYRSRRLQRENKLLEEKITIRTAQLQQSIEDLKATQTQLIQSEKMASLGELTAGIAHEIQNPLNFINNFSELNTELIADLAEEIDKGNMDEVKYIAESIATNEQKINHHGKRADSIVKGMLQHSRTGNRQKELTNINALTDEYLRLSYHGLRAKDKSFNAMLKTSYDESIGDISIVALDMGRVILNLITNAFYAVNEKKKARPLDEAGVKYEPTVTVTTSWIKLPSGAKGVEIKVADNGNGIPQKILDKIFQPFFTTKPTGQGTGLGLSLAYDIVKAHGGELKVETKEGEGCVFVIELVVS